MRSKTDAATLDLFDAARDVAQERELFPGAFLLSRFAVAAEGPLVRCIEQITAAAPWRHMMTPGGHRMSVAMTNCGSYGWITDRNGYRYGSEDPHCGKPWPQMPEVFRQLACEAASKAGFLGFVPDACLINRYDPGARMSLHQDRNERDLGQPVVSVSLGLGAMFLFGGLRREDKPLRLALAHGDVLVWGGPARLRFHGVLPVAAGSHALLGSKRINLTFRQAG